MDCAGPQCDVEKGEQQMTRIAIVEDEAAVQEWLTFLKEKSEVPRNAYVVVTEDAEALQLFPEILRIKKEHPAAYEIEAAALLSLLWCRLLRSHPMMPNEAAAKPKEPDLLVQRDMVSYIYSHYSESINLDEIAAAGKVCRNKCCQIFRRYLNQSPIDFLNHYRLEVSCHLLNNTKLSIAEICTACGFNHQSYYSKIFLRTYSCSPRDFRKRTEEKTSAEASEKD